MARRKVGTLTWSADGSRVKIQVMRGYRSDGSRRVLTRTLHDVSADEAEAEAVRMAAELGASDLAGDSMTLAEFYRGVFRDSPSNRGRPRTKGTLRGYDYAMDHYVLPTLGDVAVGRVTHDQVAAVIRAAASPKNCKTVLRAVLMAAYDMGYVAERPLQRRVPTPRARAEQVQPWDRLEVASALKAAEGWRPELRAYLALGLSGLRKSEAMAVRPCDLSLTKLFVHSHRPRGKRTTSRGRMTLSAPMMERHWSGGSGQKSPPMYTSSSFSVAKPTRWRSASSSSTSASSMARWGEREVKRDRSHPSSTASSPSMWFRTLMK